MIQAHAKKTGNAVLFESAKAFKKEVRTLRGSQRMMRISLLHQDAVAIKDEISQFSKTDILRTLEGAIQNATSASSNKEQGYVARKTTREEIGTLITEMDSLIELQLGAIMAPFMTSDINFYTGYTNAKQVKKHGTRHEKKNNGAAQDAKTETKGKENPAPVQTAQPENAQPVPPAPVQQPVPPVMITAPTPEAAASNNGAAAAV